ncbi:hypothetical protein NPIL_444311 [Nephila pilipes]|uniref:Uncharacterized protein n=1 Tax=Nephila pilipes TaxID=299642 RepID=A0A8X6IDU0_NEPPI|nr:hypothetical protein NPIL_444311 [Nephila pilipes]
MEGTFEDDFEIMLEHFFRGKKAYKQYCSRNVFHQRSRHVPDRCTKIQDILTLVSGAFWVQKKTESSVYRKDHNEGESLTVPRPQKNATLSPTTLYQC